MRQIPSLLKGCHIPLNPAGLATPVLWISLQSLPFIYIFINTHSFLYTLIYDLLGVWFIGAPNNITISHGNTWTTHKFTYISEGIRTEFNEKQKSSETRRQSKHIIGDSLFPLGFWNTEHTNGFDIITRTFQAFPSFIFSLLENGDTGSILMCFDHLSHLILFFSQKKKQENRKKWNEK